MALQFQPPPDWLLQSYFNRPNDVQAATAGLQGVDSIFNSYLQRKAMERKQQAEGLKQYVNAYAAGGPQLAGQVGQRLGLQNPPSIPTQPPQPTPPGTVGTLGGFPMTANEVEAQQSIPSEHPISPIVQASLQAGHPNLSGLNFPTNENPVDLANQGAYGQKKLSALESVQKLMDAQNAAAKKESTPKQPSSIDQILAQEVSAGRMTLDQALQKKAMGAGLTAAAVTGTKNDIQLAAEKPKAQASLSDALREYDNMINEAKAIKDDPSLSSATGLASPLSHIPGSGARRVASRLDTLKAKTLLNVLVSLKQLSKTGASGFGQLSNAEGDAIKNSVTTLDRGLATGDFKASLDRFISEMEKHKGVLSTAFYQTYGGGSPEISNPKTNEVIRETKDGQKAVFDATTKKFLRYLP